MNRRRINESKLEYLKRFHHLKKYKMDIKSKYLRGYEALLQNIKNSSIDDQRDIFL